MMANYVARVFQRDGLRVIVTDHDAIDLDEAHRIADQIRFTLPKAIVHVCVRTGRLSTEECEEKCGDEGGPDEGWFQVGRALFCSKSCHTNAVSRLEGWKS